MDCVQACPSSYYNKGMYTGKRNGEAILREMKNLQDIFAHHHKELLKQDISNFQFRIHENEKQHICVSADKCISFYFNLIFPI